MSVPVSPTYPEDLPPQPQPQPQPQNSLALDEKIVRLVQLSDQYEYQPETDELGDSADRVRQARSPESDLPDFSYLLEYEAKYREELDEYTPLIELSGKSDKDKSRKVLALDKKDGRLTLVKTAGIEVEADSSWKGLARHEISEDIPERCRVIDGDDIPILTVRPDGTVLSGLTEDLVILQPQNEVLGREPQMEIPINNLVEAVANASIVRIPGNSKKAVDAVFPRDLVITSTKNREGKTVLLVFGSFHRDVTREIDVQGSEQNFLNFALKLIEHHSALRSAVERYKFDGEAGEAKAIAVPTINPYAEGFRKIAHAWYVRLTQKRLTIQEKPSFDEVVKAFSFATKGNKSNVVSTAETTDKSGFEVQELVPKSARFTGHIAADRYVLYELDSKYKLVDAVAGEVYDINPEKLKGKLKRIYYSSGVNFVTDEGVFVVFPDDPNVRDNVYEKKIELDIEKSSYEVFQRALGGRLEGFRFTDFVTDPSGDFAILSTQVIGKRETIEATFIMYRDSDSKKWKVGYMIDGFNARRPYLAGNYIVYAGRAYDKPNKLYLNEFMPYEIQSRNGYQISRYGPYDMAADPDDPFLYICDSRFRDDGGEVMCVLLRPKNSPTSDAKRPTSLERSPNENYAIKASGNNMVLVASKGHRLSSLSFHAIKVRNDGENEFHKVFSLPDSVTRQIASIENTPHEIIFDEDRDAFGYIVNNSITWIPRKYILSL